MITPTSYTNSTISSLAPQGYWGHPTASVDWCETNYAKSHYVAEYFNSLSSFSMILVGLAGMALHASFEKRFILTFGSIVIVGIGSIAFHGTLLFPLQMLDEVPMVYCVLTVAYCCVENKPYRRYGAWFPIGLTSYGLLTTVIMLYAGPENHLLEFIVFQSSFMFMTLVVLSHIMKIYAHQQDQSIKRLWLLSGLIGAIAYGYWNIDFRMCGAMENLPLGLANPQFHAWWHVGASMSVYLVCLLICYDRAENLDRKPKIEWVGGILPHVVVEKSLASKAKFN
ncbi:alkaline phytoceramidase family protein [Gamsiella multidivaricata]|uniref:alkaline phytoceramidase family protein n=1 Tax=Gamsiella multidivaricata TaxID=101098 RepID=UPI0022204196|nr:alkaline phytoceramidase family protein [Gamsiella multidivaricata]KAI7822582.1 alkaline phytoceramidase family protein [Gamsiella multidivaricata]